MQLPSLAPHPASRLCFINYCTWVHCLSPHPHTHPQLNTHRQIQLQFPGLHCCVHFSLNCTQLRTHPPRDRQMGVKSGSGGGKRSSRSRHYSNHKISALTPTQTHTHAGHPHIAKSIKIQKRRSPFANNKRKSTKKKK